MEFTSSYKITIIFPKHKKPLASYADRYGPLANDLPNLPFHNPSDLDDVFEQPTVSSHMSDPDAD